MIDETLLTRPTLVFLFDTLSMATALSLWFGDRKAPHAQECMEQLIGGLVTSDHRVWTNMAPHLVLEYPQIVERLFAAGWGRFVEPIVDALPNFEAPAIDWEKSVGLYKQRFNNESLSELLLPTSAWLHHERKNIERASGGDLGGSLDTLRTNLGPNERKELLTFAGSHGGEALQIYSFALAQKTPATYVSSIKERFGVYGHVIVTVGTHPIRVADTSTPKPIALTGKLLTSYWSDRYRDRSPEHLARFLMTAQRLWNENDLSRIMNPHEVIDSKFVTAYLSSWREFCWGLDLPYKAVSNSVVNIINVCIKATIPNSGTAMDLAKINYDALSSNGSLGTYRYAAQELTNLPVLRRLARSKLAHDQLGKRIDYESTEAWRAYLKSRRT